MPYKVRAAVAEDASTLISFNRHMALETEKLQLDVGVLRKGVEAVFADSEKTSALYFVAEIEREAKKPLPPRTLQPWSPRP